MSSYSTYPFGDFHWKAPVANVSALPVSGNSAGDARVTLDTDSIYIWSGSAWIQAAGSTTAALTFYVDPTGSDTNTGTISAPFLTIQHALDVIPKRIRNQVDINVNAGSYTGFNLQGFTVDPSNGAIPCGIRVLGTLITATPATGTATGSFTAVTAGNINTPSFAVVTDNTQAWTVDNLKGLMIEVLTGTSVGSVFPIVTNTATTITVPSGVAFGSVAGTYAIRDWGSIITTGVPIPGILPVKGGVNPASTISGFSVYSCVSQPQNIRIEGLKINMAAGTRCANWVGVGGLMDRCWTGGTGPITGVSLAGQGQVSVQQCVIGVSSGNTAVSISGTNAQGTCSFTSCMMVGVGNGQAVSSAGSGIDLSLSQCWIQSWGLGVNISKACNISFAGTMFSSISSQAIRMRSSLNTGFFVSLIATGLDATNCGTGLEMFGPCFAQFTTLTGTGNTIGINLASGASLQIGATSTITGTTEVSIDGTATDLATMRAASPKLISSPYFSIIFQ